MSRAEEMRDGRQAAALAADEAYLEQLVGEVVAEANAAAEAQRAQLTAELVTARADLVRADRALTDALVELGEERAGRAADAAAATAAATAAAAELAAARARIAELEAGLAGRDKLVRGTYTPGAETTGPVDASRLVKRDGVQVFDLSTFTEPRVVRDVWFAGTVHIIGAGPHRLTFENCKGSGTDSRAGTAACVVAHNAGVRDVWFVDCELSPQWLGAADAIVGHHFTLVRCNVYGGIDAVGVWNAHDVDGVLNGPGVHDNAVGIFDSWLHGLLYLSPFPAQSDNRSHSDLIHIRGGINVRIEGNALDAFYEPNKGQASEPARVSSTGAHLGGNARYPELHAACAVQVSHDYGAPRQIIIRQNRFAGGTVGVNGATYGGGVVGVIADNRIARGPNGTSTFLNGSTWFVIISSGIVRSPANTFEYSGNVYEDNGAPAPAMRRGDY